MFLGIRVPIFGARFRKMKRLFEKLHEFVLFTAALTLLASCLQFEPDILRPHLFYIYCFIFFSLGYFRLNCRSHYDERQR